MSMLLRDTKSKGIPLLSLVSFLFSSLCCYYLALEGRVEAYP
jgi:hypothetical protein